MVEIDKSLGGNCCIVRCMPNTPAMIGEGITVWTKSRAVTEKQHQLTQAILDSIGEQVRQLHQVKWVFKI